MYSLILIVTVSIQYSTTVINKTALLLFFNNRGFPKLNCSNKLLHYSHIIVLWGNKSCGKTISIDKEKNTEDRSDDKDLIKINASVTFVPHLFPKIQCADVLTLTVLCWCFKYYAQLVSDGKKKSLDRFTVLIYSNGASAKVYEVLVC